MRRMDARDYRHVQAVMSKYTLSLYEKALPDDMSLFDKLLTARECGYDSMELCIDLDPKRQARLNWSKKEREALAAFLIQNEIRITTISLSALRECPLGDMRSGHIERAMGMLNESLRLCAETGAQILLINGYDVFDTPSTPETKDFFAKNIRRAAKLAASFGVILGIENAEKQFMDCIAKAAAWVNKVNNPYFRIYGDIGNSFNAMGGDKALALDDISKGDGITAAMHLKDTLPGEYRYTRFGEGHVDFQSAVNMCAKMGVRIFTAELFMRQGLDYKSEAIRVNKFLRGFLDNAVEG